MPDEPLETDDRFPSGPWVGFWLQRSLYGQGRQRMELRLTFAEGRLNGEGRDCLDEFTVRGRYDTSSGEVYFTKRHRTLGYDVFYKGFNEGKGIWGLWSLPTDRDGFHIWPKGMADPTSHGLEQERETPLEQEAPAVLVDATNP